MPCAHIGGSSLLSLFPTSFRLTSGLPLQTVRIVPDDVCVRGLQRWTINFHNRLLKFLESRSSITFKAICNVSSELCQTLNVDSFGKLFKSDQCNGFCLFSVKKV